MFKKIVMWAIVGKHGVYTGTSYTRADMIREHVNALYDIPSDYWPDTKTAWKGCREKGDRAVKVTVEYEG